MGFCQFFGFGLRVALEVKKGYVVLESSEALSFTCSGDLLTLALLSELESYLCEPLGLPLPIFGFL